MEKKICPSILSCDFLKIKDQINQVKQAGADWLHIDVMDGHFVPNLTFGPGILKNLKTHFPDLHYDVHLMITNAEQTYMDYIRAGADMITVHAEAVIHMHRLLTAIQKEAVMAGIVLNPATSVETILPVLDLVDSVLVMSVNPGFAAQSFIDSVLMKVEKLNSLRTDKNLNFIIEMDGGINEKTIEKCLAAGADWLVAGHAVFGQSDISKAFTRLENSI